MNEQVLQLIGKSKGVSAKGKFPTNEHEQVRLLYDTIAQRDQHSATPNAYAVQGSIECDLLTVSSAHLQYEWEIKRSRQDFLKDKEKTYKWELYGKAYEQGKSPFRKAGNFVPNRYYMVLVGQEDWLRDEDLTQLPEYSSVYVLTKWKRFHLIKRGKNIHTKPLSQENMDVLHRRLSYRVMGQPQLKEQWKVTQDHYEI